MFDFKEWLRQGLVDGYKGNYFSMPNVITMTANYISKGMLTISDAETIDNQCKAFDAEQEQIQNGVENDPIDDGFTHPGTLEPVEEQEEVTSDG